MLTNVLARVFLDLPIDIFFFLYFSKLLPVAYSNARSKGYLNWFYISFENSYSSKLLFLYVIYNFYYNENLKTIFNKLSKG